MFSQKQDFGLNKAQRYKKRFILAKKQIVFLFLHTQKIIDHVRNTRNKSIELAN
jgi:hypothetical protein